MYQIKEVSDLLGISKVTLRYYDRFGILKTKRSDKGYRLYDDHDLYILKNILVLKQAGFSLNDIKILTSLYELDEGDECNHLANHVINKNMKMILAQINFLNNVLNVLEEMSPLFKTHQLYKMNQVELEHKILQLFNEAIVINQEREV